MALLYGELHPVPEETARQRNPLQLAYLGDAVWELMVCGLLMQQNLNVRHMHKEAISRVSARAQAACWQRIQPQLTDAEAAVAQRARNSHVHHSVPKNQDPADYAAATALECLFGYLYLTGQEERMRCLFRLSQEE